MALLDSLAYSNADRYTDYEGRWIDASRLASEFSSDYVSVLSKAENSFIEIENPYGKLDMAYLVATVKAGEIPPAEYCEDRIRDIIIGARKQELTRQLEQDLLDKARSNGNFKIY
ncbi:MAG: hypothetical protein HUJ94_06750, partial [Bacteroidales bacterium]|nr:hypothetical protein [Bacteroidales bacterium]